MRRQQAFLQQANNEMNNFQNGMNNFPVAQQQFINSSPQMAWRQEQFKRFDQMGQDNPFCTTSSMFSQSKQGPAGTTISSSRANFSAVDPGVGKYHNLNFKKTNTISDSADNLVNYSPLVQPGDVGHIAERLGKCPAGTGSVVVTRTTTVTRNGVTQSQTSTSHANFTPSSARQVFQKLDSNQPRPQSNFAIRGGGGGGGFNPSAVREALLAWCQAKTRDYPVEITNFSSSWANGMAFCALIHHYFPRAFDFSRLNPKNRKGNFTLAFKVADELAGIMPLLDVEDMLMMGNRPDWKCVFTYVQSLYRGLKDREPLPA